MKKNANEIFMLQYRIKRYQAMGNGAMCQTLNGKLQKLLAKQATMTACLRLHNIFSKRSQCQSGKFEMLHTERNAYDSDTQQYAKS